MYKTEWEFLAGKIEDCLTDNAKLHPYPNVSEKFPERKIFLDENGKERIIYSDPDYNEGQILFIIVGPFENKKQADINQCLDHIMTVLKENGYAVQDRPTGTIVDGKTTCTIRFKRTNKASFHLVDKGEDK